MTVSLNNSIEAAQLARAVALLLGVRIGSEKSVLGESTGEAIQGTVVEVTGAAFASRSMLGLLSTARRAAATDGNVLITGESGTGKDVIARFIHQSSSRSNSPFVPFNCSTVPRDMVDSQLFGYRKGAFTGATAAFEGLIRGAAGGTIFFDEVADLPVEVQPKLLRFLDTKEVHSLGASRPTIADVRIIAATNAQPEELVSTGRFRQDLYYRLNVFRMFVPPLRERREDIGVLIERFMSEYQQRLGRVGVSLSPASRTHLLLFEWPGNVRQLSSEIYRLVANADDGQTLGPEALSLGIVSRHPGTQERVTPPASIGLSIDVSLPLAEVLRRVERAVVEHAISASGGNHSAAARRLGLSRKGLYLMRERLEGPSRKST